MAKLPKDSPEESVENAELLEQNDLPGDVAVMNLLQTLDVNDEARVMIYKQGPGGYRDLTLINEVAPADFAPIQLAQAPYNGGTFRIHIRSPSGIIGNKELKVAPAPQSLRMEQPQTQPQIDTLQLIRELSAASDIRMERMIQAMKPPDVDQLGMIERVAGILKSSQPVPQNNQGMDLGATLGVMAKMISLSKDLMPTPIPVDANGNASDMGIMMSMAKEFVSAISASKQQAGTAVALPPAQQIEHATPNTVVNNDGLTDDEREEMRILEAMYKMQLRRACKAATEKTDPTEYADSIYEMLPDGELDAFVYDPEWFERLCVLEPNCKIHQQWFTAVKDAIVRFYKEDLTEQQQQGKTSNDANSDSTNGAGGKPAT